MPNFCIGVDSVLQIAINDFISFMSLSCVLIYPSISVLSLLEMASLVLWLNKFLLANRLMTFLRQNWIKGFS